MRPAVSDPRTAIRRLNLFGVGLIILLVGGIGGWASLSELSGAVIAQGLFDVEFERQESSARNGRSG